MLNTTGLCDGVWGFVVIGAVTVFLDLQTKLRPCFRSYNFVSCHLLVTRVRSILSHIVASLHRSVVCFSPRVALSRSSGCREIKTVVH